MDLGCVFNHRGFFRTLSVASGRNPTHVLLSKTGNALVHVIVPGIGLIWVMAGYSFKQSHWDTPALRLLPDLFRRGSIFRQSLFTGQGGYQQLQAYFFIHSPKRTLLFLRKSSISYPFGTNCSGLDHMPIPKPVTVT